MIKTLSLKIKLPLYIFFFGSILVILQNYFQFKHSQTIMIEHSLESAKIMGSRIANQLRINHDGENINKYATTNTISSYLVDNLDQIHIFESHLKPLYVETVHTHDHSLLEEPDLQKLKHVLNNRVPIMEYEETLFHITGYFPIDFLQNDISNPSKVKGVLYIVLDYTKERNNMIHNIYYTFISNIVMLFFLSAIASFLIYNYIFLRLSSLHEVTSKIIQGDFSGFIKCDQKDELGDVIRSFNTMVHDLKQYKNEMQAQVNAAVSEQEQQNKLMIRQNRLASMGEMVGNIAHQWRQPLNALSLIIQKTELQHKKGVLTTESLQKNVTQAIALISNMSNTIDDFRNFFKPNKDKEFFDIEKVVYETTSLFESSLNNDNISININIKTPYKEVNGYKNEFSQVLINLISNAKDVLKERKIHNKMIFIDVSYTENNIILIVSDNAGGIGSNIIDRVFDPYYTTKEEGKGTGIGLYMSKLIIENSMHGKLSVRNNNYGAEFTITLEHTKEKQE